MGKATPDDVTFWICLFALDQHRPSEEVGKSLDDAPFNRALEQAKHGMVMVLDEAVQPFKRIWCLYEVQRSHELAKKLEIVTENGTPQEARARKCTRGENGNVQQRTKTLTGTYTNR